MALRLDIELINEFGKKLVTDTGLSLDSNGSTASGDTKKSLRYEVTPTSFKFYGRAFINTLEVGRRPTSSGGDGSLFEAIEKWIEDKRLIRSISIFLF